MNDVTPEVAAYEPEKVLDFLINWLDARNDAGLSRMLEVAPPVVSKIRNRYTPLTDSMLIRMHEVSDVSIKDLKNMMGNRPHASSPIWKSKDKEWGMPAPSPASALQPTSHAV